MQAHERAVIMAAYLWILLLLPTVQASYEYAAACVPHPYSGNPDRNQCTLMILSRSTVDIEIQTAFDTNAFTLPAGTVYERDFGIEYHPISGTENKAIRINSTDEIQVLMVKNDTFFNRFQDMYMVPNQNRNTETYFTSAYINGDCTDSGNLKHFYLISSFYTDTDISIRQQDGTTYDLTLQEFGTFIQGTNDLSNHLASGTKITSSKPINVISGNLCDRNELVSGKGYDSYVSNVPNVESLGNAYVVPKIISDDIDDSPAGFSVGVVATEDDTTVISDGDTSSIDEGESVIFEYVSKATSISVTCSKPCLVSQYTKGKNPTYGMFMQNLLSDGQFSTSAFFTTLYNKPTSYLSLVVSGEAAGDDILLNGASLGSLTWTSINGYSSAELPITGGAYELVSVNGRPFAAYVYTHQLALNTASGYALLPSEDGRVTPAPTTSASTTTTPEPTSASTTTPEPTTSASTTTSTPSPILNGTLPQHTVRVNGTAFTSDGQDVTPQCAMEHLKNLKEKNSRMLIEVNKAIGESICVESENLFDVSTVEGISVQGDKALIQIDHVLKVDWHHVAADVESCALEVADYINDLSNWQQPIFPDEPGCSRLELQPPYFNTSRTFWKCDNQMSEDLEVSNLSYESMQSEILATDDGSILDVDCTQAYTAEAAKKTTSMLGEISKALASSGCANVVLPVTQTASLIGLGDQAYFLAAFYYVPRASASFAEFVGCMADVHDFSLQHDNWTAGSQPGAPFLPIPPGCPSLEHDTDTLDDEGTRWRCPDST